MTQTAIDAIGAFLLHLEEEQVCAYETRRIRGHFLTEYLEHALNTPGTPADLSAADLMALERVDAWLTDAAAGRTRRRNTLRGPNAPSAEASDRIRKITYNAFAKYLRTPWRLEVPENVRGEHLDPDEAQRLIHTLSVRRAPNTTAPVSIRTAAVAALVAATGRTVAQLQALDVADLQLTHRPRPRVLFEGGPVDLDDKTVRILRRWMRQRAGVTADLEGADPGYLWVATQPGCVRPGQDGPPPGARRASVRTLHAAHRRLVYELLGRPVPPRALLP